MPLLAWAMQRWDLPEIEDGAWCPPVARDAATSFLAWLAARGRPYDPLAPRLARAIRSTGARRIVDLASGAGGPWPTLQPLLASHGADVDVLLTDRYPAGAHAQRLTSRIRYYPEPVDATRLPAALTGFRTVCGAYHHFAPRQARGLLEDAVRHGEGIAVLEAVERRALAIVLAALQPLPYLALAPFLGPFRWDRMLWSYLLPAAPALLAVDGVASCLRAYTARDLLELASGLDGYLWEAGEVAVARAPLHASYLIGVPRRAAVERRRGG